MNPTTNISDEQLNAFVDQQLEPEDREQVLNATVQNQKLAEKVYSLYQMKELVQQAYRQPPQAPGTLSPMQRRTSLYRWAAVFVLVSITALGGYQWRQASVNSQPHFYEVTAIPTLQLGGKRVLLHVDSNNPQRIQAAMQTVEKLMSEGHPKQIEVVANGAGLVMVRQGSPHAARLNSLATRYANLEFKACGFAMEATRLREGRPVILVPEAEKVDAALNEILRRLKQGWVYIKA